MSTTDDAVAKATDGLDDDLAPAEVVDEKGAGEHQEPKTPEKVEEGDDPTKEKDPKDDEGYTADDLEAEEEPETPKPKKPEANEIDTSGLDPEAKYIVDNLPYIVARVKDGDNVKELQIKSWTQLPDDVQFATKRDEMAFMNSLTAQENRALKLQEKFQQSQQQTQAKDFEERENTGIREDIAELQRDGDLPKFKAKIDSPEFDKDPATKEVQTVMDFMNERNEQFLKEYNQGRPFKHIGFKEAFYMYQRKNPGRSTEQEQEDKTRKEVADKFSPNRGLSSSELKKPTIKSGVGIEQILERIDAEW